MASIFYQTLMYLLFCCTWGAAFFAVWVNCADIYKTICVASILWSAFLFALTEGLNIFKAITATNLIIAWVIYLILGGGYIFSRKNVLREKIISLKQSAVSLYRDNGTSVKALIIFIAFFMLARTVLALITAPYNGDSMSYHLSRIVYWIQHQSIDYYDTSILSQLFSPVFAEYINLNIFLISGGDLFANMLQNFSAYGCLFLLYGIVRKLGCGIKWALFGCILTLSMHIFAAESITTQVDVVSAFYLMVLTYLMIEVLYDSKLTIFQFTLLGLVSGFLYITKTNACAPAAVIIIGIAIMKIFSGNFKIIPLGVISLIFIAVLVFPTFYRNYQAFDGDFMAKINVGNIAIGTTSPKYIFVNVVKNLISLGFERNTEIFGAGIKFFERLLKIDINAPEVSLSNIPFEKIEYKINMDAGVAHLVTPLFLIVTIISLIYLIKRRNKTEGLMFTLCLQVYSILIILRWQPWGSRLILPALVVVIIPIVYYFREITKRFSTDSWKYKACCFLVLDLIFQGSLACTESLIFHTVSPVKNMNYPRYERYWNAGRRTKYFTIYNNFIKLLDAGNYENIGFDGIKAQYQLLAKYVPEGKKIECVRLQGNGREIEPMNPNFSPDIILVENVELDTEKTYTCNGNVYKCVFKLVDDNNNGAVTHYSAWEKVSEKLEDKK